MTLIVGYSQSIFLMGHCEKHEIRASNETLISVAYRLCYVPVSLI